MIFPRVNRDKPEKVLLSVLNVDAATITTGYPVAFAVASSIDGISAVQASTQAKAVGFIGVAVKDIASNDYGLVQISGYVNSVFLSNVGTSVTVNAGDPLVPGPAGFFSGVPTYANSGFRWIFASNVPVAISASGYASGVIRLV